MKEERKAVVSVTDMARMCGLSRQRFYELMGMVFPFPLYDVATRRPFYTEDLQQLCLQVKKNNRGIDGNPVLFYAASRRHCEKKIGCGAGVVKGGKQEVYADLIDGVRALGLSAKEGQVVAAVGELFPSGINGRDGGEVLQAVFLHLKQHESAGKPGK